MKKQALIILFLALISWSIKAQPFSGPGAGTPDDPYQITTSGQLLEVNHHLEAHYILMNDIDLRSDDPQRIYTSALIAGYPNIENQTRLFNGTLNGNYHTIKNMVIHVSSDNPAIYIGFIGYTGWNSEILNLTVTVPPTDTIKTTQDEPTFAGILAGHNRGKIKNCHVSGNLLSNESADSWAGLLIGKSRTYIEETTASGTIIGGNIGGLIGDNSSDLTNCYAEANIYSTNYNTDTYCGGLIAKSGGDLTNCNANTKITTTLGGKNIYLGGLIGRNSSTLINCHSTTKLLNTFQTKYNQLFIGGLIGFNIGELYSCESHGSIKNYFDAEPQQTSSIGGLIGHLKYAHIVSSCTSDMATENIKMNHPYYCFSSCYGGLIGSISSPIDANFNNCFASGSFKNDLYQDQPYYYAGGFIGSCNEHISSTPYNITLTTCHTTVDMNINLPSADIYNNSIRIGGFFGIAETTNCFDCFSSNTIIFTGDNPTAKYSVKIAPFSSLIYDANIRNCYTATKITLPPSINLNIPSFCNSNSITQSTITSCVYDKDFQHNNTPDNEEIKRFGIKDLTTEEFANQEFFESNGWDFDISWQMKEIKGVMRPGHIMNNNLKGKGTIQDPFQIFTREELINVSYNPKCHYKLMSDIDFSADNPNKTYAHAPIHCKFEGSFDGNGHKIINLSILQKSTDKDINCGLFESIQNGTIKNLTIELASNDSIYVNSTNNNSQTGILAGQIISSTITQCAVSGTLSSTSQHATSGGIAGYIKETSITNCLATGIIRTESNILTHAGGIAGELKSSTIKNCYSTSAIYNQCYNTSHAGSFAGAATSTSIQSSFFDNQTSNLPDMAVDYGNYLGITPLTTEQFNSPDIFLQANWNFENRWKMGTIEETIRPILNQTETIEGEGTPINPYQITNIKQLPFVAENPQAHYILMNDLNLRSEENKTYSSAVIGQTKTNAFTGHFNGDGHTISNLAIHSDKYTQYIGFFGYLSYPGQVSNLIIEIAPNDSISNHDPLTENYIGGLAGYCDGAKITQCQVSGHLSSTAELNKDHANYNKTQYIGLLTGKIVNSSITQSSVAGTLYKNSTGPENSIGGITGYATKSHITNCYNDAASITVCYNGSGFIGGIAGYLDESVVKNSATTGLLNISSYINNTFSGGFTGKASDSQIDHCFSKGENKHNLLYSVYATQLNIAGFIGNCSNTNITNCFSTTKCTTIADETTIAYKLNIGGFVALLENSPSVISKCYAAGQISSSSTASDTHLGGFAGTALIPTQQCFYDSQTTGNNLPATGQGTSDGITPLTTLQFGNQTLFEDAAWDFTNDWNLTTLNETTRPELQNALQTTFFVTNGYTPVCNASITIGEQTYSTNDKGIASFLLPQGTYNYQISAQECLTENGTIIKKEQPLFKQTYLSPTLHEATFTVLSQNKPLPNATITICNQAVVTDSQGKAIFNLPYGSFACTIEADNHSSANVTVEFNSTSNHHDLIIEPLLRKVTFMAYDNSIPHETTIHIAEQEITTNKYGVVAINLPQGEYELTATTQYFDTLTCSISIADCEIIKPLYITATQYPINIHVSYKEAPVANATISLNGINATTNEEGNANLLKRREECDILIEHPDFENFTTTDFIEAEENNFSFELTPKPVNLTIHVIDESEENLYGTTVTINQESIITHDDGQALFSLIPGEYKITLSKPSFDTLIHYYQVHFGDNEITLMLIKSRAEVTFIAKDLGVPVSNTTIKVGDRTGITDETGTLVLNLIENKSYSELITHPLYSYLNKTLKVEESPKTVNIDMYEARFKVHIYIKNEDDHFLQDAQLTIDGNIEENPTDIHLIRGEHDYTITCPGYDDLTGVLEAPSPYLTYVMTATPYIATIHVIDENGPLPNAKIELNNQLLYTDNEGNASFNVTIGEYTYKITADDHEDVEESLTVTDHNITVEAEAPMRLYEIDFYTHFESTPLHSVGITINEIYKTTNNSGHVSFYLRPGTYEYHANPYEYNLNPADGTIILDKNDTEESIAFNYDGYNITLILLDEKTNEPLEDIYLKIGNQSNNTNSQGEAIFKLNPGYHTCEIHSEVYGNTEKEIHAGYSNESHTFTLLKINSLATFTILDPDNMPSQGSTLKIDDIQYGVPSNGILNIYLPFGDHHYIATNIYGDTVEGDFTTTEEPFEQTIIITVPLFTLTMNITDDEGPVYNAKIAVEQFIKYSDENGQATFELEAGTYSYTVSADGYETIMHSFTGHNTNVVKNVLLTKVTYKNTFTVTYKGTPIEGATVTIGDQSFNTNASGQVVFDLIPGTYIYSVSAEDYDALTAQFEATEQPQEIAIDMEATGLESITDNQRFTIYPNPAQSIIHIGCENPEMIASVEIINPQGQTIYANENIHTTLTEINVEQFATHLMIIKITLHDGTVVSEKIMH